MPPAPLAERIARYVARPDRDSFDELATAAFSELYGRDEAFRELCDRTGASPDRVSGWRSIPAASLSVEAAVSDSAGATLQRDAAGRAFETGCLASLGSPPILELVPGEGTPAEQRLARSCAELAERFGGPGSGAAVEGGRLQIVAARSWLAGRQRDRRPAVLLATFESLERLIRAFERQDLRFQLAFGSRVVLMDEPGDPPPDVDAGALRRHCFERLALAAGGVRRRLLWPGVPTPLYGKLREDGGLDGAAPAPWLRVRALDPDTLDEVREGETGLLSVLDLTIRGRPFQLLTSTRGTVEPGAVRVMAPTAPTPAA